MAAFNISLADLSQDIAGVIPPELVLAWNDKDKSSDRHDELLSPFKVSGTIASSDSAGLSQLTQKLNLPQVLKLVSEPKEVIHQLGTAIGGKAIGVWAADNTQMFYPQPIEPSLVVVQMLAAQARVKSLLVQIGLGIHVAECYQLAGGLFGPQADWIEEITEDDTAGGEILVSEVVLDQLPQRIRSSARLRADLSERGRLWSLVNFSGTLNPTEGGSTDYPTPFDQEFFGYLRSSSLEFLATDLAVAQYIRHKTVVFVKVPHRDHGFLLDGFTEMTLLDLSIRRVVDAYAQADLVKSNGVLAIVLFESSLEALQFSRDVVETVRQLGSEARIGLTRGEVSLFPLAGGGRDIAGNPVNLASKLSEDSGLEGILADSSSGLETHELGSTAKPFRLTVSKIELRGHQISV